MAIYPSIFPKRNRAQREKHKELLLQTKRRRLGISISLDYEGEVTNQRKTELSPRLRLTGTKGWDPHHLHEGQNILSTSYTHIHCIRREEENYARSPRRRRSQALDPLCCAIRAIFHCDARVSSQCCENRPKCPRSAEHGILHRGERVYGAVQERRRARQKRNWITRVTIAIRVS